MESGNHPENDVAGSAESVVPGDAKARWWLWPNLLSLDAPLVAVAWLWLLSTTLSIRIPEPWWCYGILAAAVWVVYVSDRLLDGLSIADEGALTARHRFYRRYQILFLVLLVPAAGIAIYGVLNHAPSALLWFGIVVAFVSVFYLMLCASARLKNDLLNKITILSAASVIAILVIQAPVGPGWIRFGFLAMTGFMAVRLSMEPGGNFFQALPKEIFCGFTFAIGVSIPVLVWSELALVNTLLLGGLFSLNCIAIALYEEKHDKDNDPIAITRIRPQIRRLFPYLVTGVAALAVALAFLEWEDGTYLFPLAVAAGALLLGALHVASQKLGSGALRVLADFVLLLPPVGVFLLRRFGG